MKKLRNKYLPGFKFDGVTINKNVRCAKHVDKNTLDAYVMFLGNFHFGALREDNKIFDQKYRFFKHNPQIPHWNDKINGDKITLIIYSRFRSNKYFY